MEILEKSFELEGSNMSGLFSSMGIEEDSEEITISLEGKNIQLILEDYIKERQATYETGLTFISDDDEEES